MKLKIVHTYGVVAQSTEITKRMGLPAEDVSLARIIALLHDIGRFEQLKRYDSFMPDTMDHASYGVQVLFREGMIRRFVSEDTWDDIIEAAIAKHSDFVLEGIEDERTLLHARIIRDADKLDNCRVKLVDARLRHLWERTQKRSALHRYRRRYAEMLLKGRVSCRQTG